MSWTDICGVCKEHRADCECKMWDDVDGKYSKKFKPKLEDFYDTSDPRGCSSSEYDDYQKALNSYLKQNKI